MTFYYTGRKRVLDDDDYSSEDELPLKKLAAAAPLTDPLCQTEIQEVPEGPTQPGLLPELEAHSQPEGVGATDHIELTVPSRHERSPCALSYPEIQENFDPPPLPELPREVVNPVQGTSAELTQPELSPDIVLPVLAEVVEATTQELTVPSHHESAPCTPARKEVQPLQNRLSQEVVSPLQGNSVEACQPVLQQNTVFPLQLGTPVAPVVATPPQVGLQSSTPQTRNVSLSGQDTISFSDISLGIIGGLGGDARDLAELRKEVKDLSDKIDCVAEGLNKMETTMSRLTSVLTKIVTTQKADFTAVQKADHPKYSPAEGEKVWIGDENNSTTIEKNALLGAFFKCETGKDYCLKLMTMCLSPEVLSRSNFQGGRVLCGQDIVIKDSLMANSTFKAILAQVEFDFPGSTSNQSAKTLKEAVNNKCRKAYRRY